MSVLDELKEAIVKGNFEEAACKTEQSLEEGIAALQVLIYLKGGQVWYGSRR